MKNPSNKHLLIITSILLITLLTFSLNGCGTKKQIAPFCNASWETVESELLSSLGSASNSYDSVYLGTTYVYNTNYLGRDGSVKYMFDDKGALMCMAFTYVPASSEDVTSLYDEIHTSLEKELGESGYNTDQGNNFGDVWYRNEGDIIISCMITSEQNALQYSYLNPTVSKFQMENAANSEKEE